MFKDKIVILNNDDTQKLNELKTDLETNIFLKDLNATNLKN